LRPTGEEDQVSLVDSSSLANTADRINHAHFFGEKITKQDAREASRWIVSRYSQDIPERIRNSAKPDPRWASIPKSFNLTAAERRKKPKTFTGEPLANASLRAVHSREATRALFILGAVLGEPSSEALSLCESVRDTANHLKTHGTPLYCCGPCTASVWRLAGIGAPVAADDTLDHLLSALPKHRDPTGAWRRFPFFYTLLALSELDHPKAVAELQYALPECERRRKTLKPDSAIAARRIAVLDQVFDATS
jgi:hypothetical protein